MSPRHQAPVLTWRQAMRSDLAAISEMADRVHTELAERPEVFAEKMQLFPEGCLVLVSGRNIAGYAMSHPWRRGSIPPLDAFLGAIPAASDCLFIHDVVVLPEARGRHAAAALIDRAAALAKSMTFGALALVSVYKTHLFWARLGFTFVADPALGDKLASYGNAARYMVRELE